jgi:hypothetical protein
MEVPVSVTDGRFMAADGSGQADARIAVFERFKVWPRFTGIHCE